MNRIVRFTAPFIALFTVAATFIAALTSPSPALALASTGRRRGEGILQYLVLVGVVIGAVLILNRAMPGLVNNMIGQVRGALNS